ncbi:MAG: MmgE/PrpD family protein [Acetobacteraceae bacterium]
MTRSVIDFIHDVQFADLPPEVVAMTRTCILDLVGVTCAGSCTAMSRIARDFAARHLAAGEADGAARLMLDGRASSVAGVAFAGAATIDSFDAHDGHPLTKGHAGVAVWPAALGLAQVTGPVTGRVTGPWDGKALLASVAIGYEVALRAGIALHATARDYHTSGAWNALACAALGARALGLGATMTRHALGIAEYHGPRSPMMRCVDHPTMVKDGSAWGALSGVNAALLAADGFTGAPAALTEQPEVGGIWADLGERWRILELYFKAYPVCRWAHPAVEAALALQRQWNVRPAEIAGITISSFEAAIRLATRAPRTTEEAQYSLPFPVAAALVRGTIGTDEVSESAFTDPEIERLSAATVLELSADHERLFPAERWAQVTFRLADGRIVTSEPAIARGNRENPLSAEELVGKYRALARPVVGEHRGSLIEAGVANLCEAKADIGDLLDDLVEPAERERAQPTALSPLA